MGTFGPSYQAAHDEARLTTQRECIRDVMLSAGARGSWLTLCEIEKLLHYPQASISAQLRHLRKQEFGGYILEKRARGDRDRGLYEYKLTRPPYREPKQLDLLEGRA
jgi:hypothetical protein